MGALPYAASSKIVQQVKNASGSTMAKGSVVYISGATGGDALVTLADADSEMTSSKTLGLLATAIDNDAYGNVIEQGLLSGVNTALATAGQSVWLSSTAGQFVFGSAPAKPAHSVYLGVVTRVHATEGEILVKVQNGYELNELHDVNAGSPSTNDVLQWNGTAWVNADVVTQVTSAIVDSAPATLDTLNELAAALGDDANFATTVAGQIAAKQDTITGAASTIVSADLTADRVLVAGGSGKVATSGVTKSELETLTGVTSAIQSQLNGKAATSHTHTLSNITDVTATATELNVLDGITATTTELNYVDGVTSAIQTQLDSKSPVTQAVSDKSANYTLQSSDLNSLIRSTNAAITITVPDVLSNGQRIDFLQAGTGQITFAGSGITINSADAKLKTAKQYAAATVLKAGGAYYLIGNLG